MRRGQAVACRPKLNGKRRRGALMGAAILGATSLTRTGAIPWNRVLRVRRLLALIPMEQVRMACWTWRGMCGSVRARSGVKSRVGPISNIPIARTMDVRICEAMQFASCVAGRGTTIELTRAALTAAGAILLPVTSMRAFALPSQHPELSSNFCDLISVF